MNILENIKKIRGEKKITQADISEKLGLAQNNYGNIERGITELTVSRLYEIANVLGVSANELLGEPMQATDNIKVKELESRVLELEEIVNLQRQLLEEKNQKLDKAYKTFEFIIFFYFIRIGNTSNWNKLFDKDKNGFVQIKMTDEELEDFVNNKIMDYIDKEKDGILTLVAHQWTGDKRLLEFINKYEQLEEK
jgi:transcriptional regulator with XRE-family HTH domain